MSGAFSGGGDDGALAMRWLCHDMATPIATLLTASELLSDQGDSEINELICAAIRKLSARLRLVRLAMGSRSTLAPAALARLLAEALPDTPLGLDIADDAPLPANVLAGAALILSDLGGPAGFDIDVQGARWRDGRALPETAQAILQGAPATDARTAMIALVARHAQANGRRLSAGPGGLVFEVV